ncbi:MAG: M20/M25/M40 family metallo-hydrolase [Oscillospiraceae bacterium]|jgi:endoglucanase|nr:M20/M25/M40 family metallo-hydrolase [Oscillospiraceae bacterium]
MDVFEVLKRLTRAAGVSGGENSAASVASDFLKEYANAVGFDCHGSVTGFIGNRNNGRPVILLDAHIDEIGLIVTHIDKEGFVKAEPCGGVDRRSLSALTVTVHGKEPVKGVICSSPPHAGNKNEEAALKAGEIRIDTGYGREGLEKIISPGDKITADGELTRLLGGKVSGRALDNRAGVTAVLYALSLLKNGSPGFNIAVAFTVQEELGCRGGRVAAYNADADYAIVTDVSYGISPAISPNEEHKCGKPGGGPMLGFAPSLDREMFDGLRKTAEDWEIPYQLEIMNRDTGGTNADEISLAKGGVKTALVSVPLRYMHTPVETVALSDVEAAGQLIAAYIEGFNSV